MGDPRRQNRDHLTKRVALAVIQLIADRSGIDDENRPTVMAVSGIGVIDDLGVEDLGDPVDGRMPRFYRTSTR